MRPVLPFALFAAAVVLAQQPPAAPLPPLMACGSPAANGAEVLCGAKSPEDLELTPDGKALIVAQFASFRSPNERVGVALFNLATKQYSPIAVTNAPDKAWGDAACPGPIGDQLAAHGTSLVKRTSGAWQYFVVNHGGRESIEMFELKMGAAGPALYWHGCVIADKAFNDVAALADGGFIATHPTGMQTPGQSAGNIFDGQPTGWVARWTPGKGESELPGTRFGYPNGVVASADGRYAYYAAWTAKELHKYDLRAGKDISVTKLDFMPDNLTWAQKGQLIAAGVHGSRGNCGALPCIYGFSVAQFDAASMKPGPKFDSGERSLISGVSVAIKAGPAVYVGAFQGDRLVKLDWKQ
jgi:SMP-30/Gluconolactonase/LRE-like region